VTLQRAVMRMVRWMCGIKLQDRIPSIGLSAKLVISLIGNSAAANKISSD